MQAALAEAEAAAARGEVPVGAVLTDTDGRIVAAAGNRVEADHDPTAHAEMLVLRAGAAALGAKRLESCDLYVTLEPCPMCAAAIGLATAPAFFILTFPQVRISGLAVYLAAWCNW